MEYQIKNSYSVEITNSKEQSASLEIFNATTFRYYTQKNNLDLLDLNLKHRPTHFEVQVLQNEVHIVIKNLTLVIDDLLGLKAYKDGVEIVNNPRMDNEKKTSIVFDIGKNNPVLGLGDKMNALDKRGYKYRQWNLDIPIIHTELAESLYKSINVLYPCIHGHYYGIFFPSTYPYDVDIAHRDLTHLIIESEDAEYDYFLFLNDSLKKIIIDYTALVGRPYLIRFKMLGHQQSRWSYETETQVKEVIEGYEKTQIPLEYIHYDIHHMENYKNLTLDKNRFPNIDALASFAKDKGVEFIYIYDAGYKKEEGYEEYEYLKDHHLLGTYNNEPYVNIVWPGEAVFPNYFDPMTTKYLESRIAKFMEKVHASGMWNDMNEPATFKGELPDDVDFSFKKRKLLHKEAHNIYGEKMAKVTFDLFMKQNKRPYIFSRAAFATTMKYAFVWNGDNYSLWHHLLGSIAQVTSLGLCGFGVNGVDLGGFGGDTNKQLLIRWVEANFMFPFLRNHSSLNTLHQEAYAFDEETSQIYKKYIDLRYKWMPYLYSELYKTTKTGIPFVRPLLLEYEEDEIARNINDEYMVGDRILISPIVSKDTYEKIIYLPKGRWIDINNSKLLFGGKKIIYNMPLDTSGIFIRYNSIVPEYEHVLRLDKSKIDTLGLHIYGTRGELELYDDDGESLDYQKGIYNLYQITYRNGKLKFKSKVYRYETAYRQIKIIHEGKEIIIKFQKEFEVEI